MCAIVRADTVDLGAFVDGGASHVAGLRGVFDRVSAARSRTISALGVGDLPRPRAARLDGGRDPLGEQIAEAGLANLFVDEIRRALLDDDTAGLVGWSPADLIDRALAEAGLDALGADRSMAIDEQMLADAAIRRELNDILAGIDDDLPDHLRATPVGMAVEEWLAADDGSDPERTAAMARVLVDRGVELQAGLGGDEIDGPEGAVSTMLVTQGVLLWPGDRGDLLDDLADRGALPTLVDALDLDQTVDDLAYLGPFSGEWHRANQPWVRNAALIMLIDASIDRDGTISPAGQALADDVLDRYPAVVEEADNTWHGTGPFYGGFDDTLDRYQSTAGGRACRVWPTEGIRSALARAMTAPNYDLSDVRYRAALALDELDIRLIDAASADPDDAADLWLQRLTLIAELTRGDPDRQLLLDQALAQGLSAPEALRLVDIAADQQRTDDRVRHLRVLYPTTAWGDPVDPTDQSLPTGLTTTRTAALADELGVLQTVQLARYAEGRPTPEQPLTLDQVDVVRRYAAIAPWFQHRFAGAFPGGAQAAADYLATYRADGDGDLSDILFDMPDGFEELLVDLTDPANQTVWDLMAGAAGNDTFLGPDGAYRPANGRYTTSGDAQALLVQMALLTEIGPYHADLDLDASGTIHEDEVADWLARAADDPSIPPALVDRIRLGTSHGIGEDTFGWDEVGEIIGWVGLAAAVTATIVYSGGAAAPMWVQAGLVGLAGLEAVAFTMADDPTSAALAGLGGLADLAAAARLIRAARIAPIDVTDNAVLRAIADGTTPAEVASALRAAGIDPTDPIIQRRAQNAGLMADADRFADDLGGVGITPNDIDAMRAGRKPLGFESEQQWQQFQDELVDALTAAGLDDAEIGLKGTATTFYSENPKKPLGHHWDADPANPGDFDFNVLSPSMVADMEAAGIQPSQLNIFGTQRIHDRYPELESFAARWGEILGGREVNFVGLPGSSVVRDPTEYVVVSVER